MVVELRARFDEKANISLATRLQEAGVQVVYGIVGYETHAKMLLVLRREGKHLRYYTHLGTGNCHPKALQRNHGRVPPDGIGPPDLMYRSARRAAIPAGGEELRVADRRSEAPM